MVTGTKLLYNHSLFFNPKIEQLCQEVQAVAAAARAEAVAAEAKVVNPTGV